MPEFWDHPFGYALLKIERANNHVAEIEKRISVSSDSYGPSVHVDIKTGKKFIYCAHTDWKLAVDLALIVGDAIHNIHAALDVAWVEIVRKFSAQGPTRYTRFPIDSEGDRQKLEDTLTKSTEITHTHPVIDLMLDHIKPYSGGDSDLLAINSLDNNDKHLLLIPLVTVAAIRGIELEHEDSRIEMFDIFQSRGESFRKVIPLETKLKNHGQVTFHVTFRKATGLNDSEVIPTLRRFSAKTLKIVRILQRMVQQPLP